MIILLTVALSLVVICGLVYVLIGCIQCFVGKRSAGFSNFENPNEDVPNRSRSEENPGFSLDPSDLAVEDTSGYTTVTIEPLPDILSKTTSTSALRPRIRCLERSKQESAVRHISLHHPFPRVQLTYLKEIGSTWFGQVIESDAEKIITGVPRNRVIVKVLKDTASNMEQKQFLEDVAPYRELDHTNVIRLLGQCTESTPLLLILEYAPLGDLKSYLRNHKTGTPMFAQKNLQLKFGLDVASGLACLHRHDYVHNDLATRTCLVAGDHTVKIGDYGCPEEKYQSDYYNNGQELLPIRWMAPETLEHQETSWQITEITKPANIWSFGVLLWEIITYGNLPYVAVQDEEVLESVVQNKIMKLQPPDSTLLNKDRLFEVMQFCWLKPEQRPKIEEVHGLLQRLFEQTAVVSQNGEDEFEKKWDALIPKEIQVPKQYNLQVTPKQNHEFESDFTSSNEINGKLSTTVNGGLDFTQSLPTDASTPFKPIREHLTSTPLAKNKNYDKTSLGSVEVGSKPVSIEAIMKSSDVPSMNDSALDDDAFESTSKPEDNRQTESLVTSAETVTSGVVTGDFSMSGKHSVQSPSASEPQPEIHEIHKETKDDVIIPIPTVHSGEVMNQFNYEQDSTDLILSDSVDTTGDVESLDNKDISNTDLLAKNRDLKSLETKDSFDIVSDLSTSNLDSTSAHSEDIDDMDNLDTSPDRSKDVSDDKGQDLIPEPIISGLDLLDSQPIQDLILEENDSGLKLLDSRPSQDSVPEQIISGLEQLDSGPNQNAEINLLADHDQDRSFNEIPSISTKDDLDLTNSTQLSDDPFSDLLTNQNMFEKARKALTSADINSTLGADIDDFLNTTFDAPINKSSDKSSTDFSELENIFNGQSSKEVSNEAQISLEVSNEDKRSMDLSNGGLSNTDVSNKGQTSLDIFNEVPDEKISMKDDKSNSPEPTIAEDLIKVFDSPTIMTTDLDEDLPPLADVSMATNTTSSTDTVTQNSTDTMIHTSDNLLDL